MDDVGHSERRKAPPKAPFVLVEVDEVRDRLLGIAAATLYQPIDTIANCKEWKAGAGDGTGRASILLRKIRRRSLCERWQRNYSQQACHCRAGQNSSNCLHRIVPD